MAGPVEPVLGVGEGVENLDWLHTFLDQRNSTIQSFRVGSGFHRRQNRFAFFEPEIVIVWKRLVRCLGSFRQLLAKLNNKLLGLRRNTGLLAIAGQFWFDFLPGQQSAAVIPELVAGRNTKVTRYSMDRLIKRLKGVIIPIQTPHDLADAIQHIGARISKAAAPPRDALLPDAEK